MKPKFRRIFPVLLLAMLTPGASALAQQEDQNTGNVLDAMMREGWKPVAPGVLQRHQEGGRVETFALGPEGLKWAVREVQGRLAFLKKEYRAYRKDDVRRAIQNLRREISKLQEDLERSQGEPLADVLEKVDCTVNHGASADAFPLTAAAGVGATASAYFNSDCGYEAETYASAYARATANGTTNTVIQETPRTGSDITSSATASVQGTVDCLSEAYSYARYSPANIFYSVSDSNTSCAPPLTVAISGTELITVYYDYSPRGSGCVTETWSATASGGTPPYSYEWSVGSGSNLETATGSSYSRTVCPDDPGFSLTVTVTDGASQVASDSHYVEVMTCDPRGVYPCTIHVGS